jgi:ribosomal-protein-alanine N-acetyltransferase
MTDPAALAAVQARALAVPRPWSAAEIADLLASAGTILCAPDAMGFALGRTIADEAELLTLVVDPTARRTGRGRALLAAFEDAARQAGAQTAFLEVAADNDAARALYTGAGWQQRGRRRRYYLGAQGLRIDALVMAKPLTDARDHEKSC